MAAASSLVGRLWPSCAEHPSLPLYLGTSEAAVRAALSTKPAALLLEPTLAPAPRPVPFHLVFDWDSTLASDEGDLLISREGRAAFARHEWAQRNVPHAPGPLQPVLLACHGNPAFRLSVLTARTGAEAYRVLTTLAAWGVQVSALHFAGNQAKGPIAAAIAADLFLDDIRRHVEAAVHHGVRGGWVPFGAAME